MKKKIYLFALVLATSILLTGLSSQSPVLANDSKEPAITKNQCDDLGRKYEDGKCLRQCWDTEYYLENWNGDSKRDKCGPWRLDGKENWTYCTNKYTPDMCEAKGLSEDEEQDEAPDPSGGSTDIGSERDSTDCSGDLGTGNCGIIDMIMLITGVLSGLAATVIVAMIVVGGIQYSMAGADPSRVQAAKQKITNALLALLLLIFGFSFIQWIVPGGLI